MVISSHTVELTPPKEVDSGTRGVLDGLVPQGPPAKAERKKPKALNKTSAGPIKIGIGSGVANAAAATSASANPQPKPKHVSLLGQDESDDDDESGADQR